MAAMAHVSVRPGAEKPGEQRVGGLVELQRGQAILAFLALANLAAEQVRHELLSVTDSQHGLAVGKDAGVHRGAAGVVNARRAAGDDDALREGDCRGRGLTGPHFGVDPEIADFSRDQMTVLPARVQDHDLWSGIQTSMVTGPLPGGAGGGAPDAGLAAGLGVDSPPAAIPKRSQSPAAASASLY
jgi:hypothetical protein